MGRGGDDQYFSDARVHECGQGVVNHRLVVNRHQLLGNPKGYWPKPASRTSRKYYSTHHTLISKIKSKSILTISLGHTVNLIWKIFVPYQHLSPAPIEIFYLESLN